MEELAEKQQRLQSSDREQKFRMHQFKSKIGNFLFEAFQCFNIQEAGNKTETPVLIHCRIYTALLLCFTGQKQERKKQERKHC